MTEYKDYAFTVKLDMPFERAVEKTMEALKEQGFGVLTDIDVKAVFKKKLDKDFRQYRILGACNPPYAWETLNTDLDVGLMLPCNVIVYEENNSGVRVSAINPVSALQVIPKNELKTIAAEVSGKLKLAVDSLSG